jgi:hypothetical protein
MTRLRWLSCCLALSASACGGSPKTGSAPAPTLRHYTFRGIGGVSMGAMGSSFIGTSHPELFDAIGSLGSPMDFTYILHSFETSWTGGFCTLPELQALLAQDPTGAILNSPAALGCMHPPTPRFLPYEHTGDFNHWRYTDNGGSFDRDADMNIFEDISAAFGNLLTYNPQSSYFPPGMTADIWAQGASLCTTPLVIPGKANGGSAPIYNAEYNPQGQYDVISFCDGQRPIYSCADTPDQEIDWCQMQPGQTASTYPTTACASLGGAVQAEKNGPNQALFLSQVGSVNPCYPNSRPISILLAVDINGNGKRDYGEPILSNAHERFQDTGADGCFDAMEDGKGGCVTDAAQSPYDPARNPDPNGDDYDFRDNPLGTENDFRWEQGEPFADDGLDGVPGTGDYGEGNGVFDVEPAYQNYFAVDARTNIRNLWPTLTQSGHLPQLQRIDYLIDGGVRDVVNFGVSGAQVFGLLHALLPPSQTQLFADFSSWPSRNAPFTDLTFEADQADWSLIPRDLMTFYGDLIATPEEILSGDGDHLGTVPQAVDRFEALFYWFSHRWDAFPDVPVGSNPESAEVRQSTQIFPSTALGADRDFAIALPPGYDSPENAEARYPVIYVGHGYGMDAAAMMGIEVVFDSDMLTGDMRKMISVFPSGRCCFTNTQTGEHQCTEYQPNGTQATTNPWPSPWVSECNAGNFFVNAQGGPNGPPRAYLDSFLELTQYIDANYRTLSATGGQDVAVP